MTIPLTVIGGFLGAGKTSLLNRVLAAGRRRYGVLVNDFGAVNVDASLIAAADGGLVEMANGCLCCSLGADLGGALELLARRARPPEHVLVEASGVADPWRIAQLALIEPGFELQPLVVMADAATLARQLADRWTGDAVRRHFVHADVVGLSRTDIADAAAANAAIRALRPEAHVVAAPFGELSEALLRFEGATPVRGRGSRLAAEDVTHPFRSWTWRDPPALDRDRLRAVLRELPRSVLRVKGVVRVGAEGAPHLLQYAAERWAITPFAGAAPGALVAIGTPEMPEPEEMERMFVAACL